MEHISLENEARRLRELFKGRFNQRDAILLVTHHGENAANYVLQESPENVAKFLEKDRTVRFSEEEVARVNRLLIEGLESESKPRLFACRKCEKCWWKRVPTRKQVSRCFQCSKKYDPVPEEDEWGLGEFECHFCGYFFRSTAIMNITECVCHKCNHTVKVSRITPPSKKRRQVPNRQYHHCNGENCYARLTLPSKCDGCANNENKDVPHNDVVAEPEADTCKCSRRPDRRGGLQRPFNDNEMVQIRASEPQGPGHEKQTYQDGNFVGMKLPNKELKTRQMQLDSHEIGLKLQEVTLEELHIDLGKREACREEQGMNRKKKLACQIQPAGEMKEKLACQIQPAEEMKEKLACQIQPAGEMKEKLACQIQPAGDMKEKLACQIQPAREMKEKLVSQIQPAGEMKEKLACQIQPAEEMKEKLACQIQPAGEMKEKLACQIQPAGEMKEKLVSQVKPKGEMKKKLVSQIQPAGEVKEKLVSQIQPAGEMKEKLVDQVKRKGEMKEKLVSQAKPKGEMKKKLVSQIQPAGEMKEKLVSQIQPAGEMKEKLVSQVKRKGEMKEKLVSQAKPKGEMKKKLVSQIQPAGEMKEKLVSQIHLKGKRLLHKDELEHDEQALKPNEPVVERPLCYHPFSVQYLPKKAVVRKFSEEHESKASTVTTCLDQGSLKTEPLRVAYTLYSKQKKHKH